jgi:hypothetical protein
MKRTATTHPGVTAIVAAASFLACLTLPLMGRKGLPVNVSLSSAHALRAGEPVTIIAVVQSGAGFPMSAFEVAPSSDWRFAAADTYWAGSLRGRDVKEFQFSLGTTLRREGRAFVRLEFNARGSTAS